MKCLIVDDQVENRMVLSKIIEPYGEFDLVVDGAEAVELFKLEFEEGQPYNLVLMDIMMPVMDGQEALRKIRTIEQEAGVHPSKGSTIMMVTAVDASSEMRKAFEEGLCSDYINKPISRGKLLVKLAEHNLIPKNWWKEGG
ncbi:MAG: response regulator [Magnetococcales bacterium]|nr:response regulator [Magnetococcales bacterium]